MVELLSYLGFDAHAVHAFQNRVPDGTGAGHTWVSVSLDGERRFIDSIFYIPDLREINFTTVSKIHNHTSVFKIFTRSGEAALNAHRYYVTQKDL